MTYALILVLVAFSSIEQGPTATRMTLLLSLTLMECQFTKDRLKHQTWVLQGDVMVLSSLTCEREGG